MIFDKNEQKLRMVLQLKYMDNFARMFGPDHHKKVEEAKRVLREMQKLDPHVMTVAMTVVGCEGFIDMIDHSEELAVEIAKNKL